MAGRGSASHAAIAGRQDEVAIRPFALLSRRAEPLHWPPGVMAQRASLRDHTSLAVEKRRSNRTVYLLRGRSRAA
jgi:hypothetical protein